MCAGNRLSDRSRPGSGLPLASEPKLTGVPVNQSLTSPQQPVSHGGRKSCGCGMLKRHLIMYVLIQVSPYQHTVDELIRGVEYPAKVVFTSRFSV